MSSVEPDQNELNEAGKLAFSMVRFAEGVSYPVLGDSPPGVPKLGVDVYSFFPWPQPIRLKDVPSFLINLPCPALLIPTMTRGMVSLHLLDELSPARAKVLQHELDNQSAGLDELAAQYGLDPDSNILLEFGNEAHILTLATLRVWSKRFGVYVGWNIARLDGDARAVARLNLFRSDGASSIGAPGPGKQV